MANGWDSQQKKSGGGPMLGICTALVVFGTMLTSAGAETGGVILIVLAAAVMIGWSISKRASANKPPVRRSATPPKKACPNPEKHRHYEAPKPAKQQYRTYTQTAPARSDNQRRLENARRLYDAGLLTKEEFDAEARRYR